MLNNIPQDQAFTQLIITQLVTYHDKCSTWYKGRVDLWRKYLPMLTALALVTRARVEGAACLKPAAAWVDSGDLAVIVKTIWNGDDADRERLLQKVPSNLHSRLRCQRCILTHLQEAELLITETNETPLEPYDIISDRRSVTALCLLYSSMVSSEDHFEEVMP
jgi:exocyst complex component 4